MASNLLVQWDDNMWSTNGLMDVSVHLIIHRKEINKKYLILFFLKIKTMDKFQDKQTNEQNSKNLLKL